MRNIICIFLFIVACLCLGRGLIIPAKAFLSVHLLEHAWNKARAGDSLARPWPWMDSRPVAKLTFPSQNHKSYVVMEGVSGSVLAFSPGWHPETSYPGTQGITLISAHNDTHFRYLKMIEINDIITMTDTKNTQHHFRTTQIFTTQTPKITIAESSSDLLILTTCAPSSIPGQRTLKRYAVIAKKI